MPKLRIDSYSMADYLLVHDRLRFDTFRDVLASAWRRRSFLDCAPHRETWRAAAAQYARAYHVDPRELFLLDFAPTTAFSAGSWRTLVGELLVVTADEMPELPGHLESLTHLLPVPLATHMLEGYGDLTFGLATYRPGHARFNSIDDNRRILAELLAIDPSTWRPEMLGSDEMDAADELLFAREWFEVIMDLYQRVVRDDRVLVFETIHG